MQKQMSSRNAEMETWNLALPNPTLPFKFVHQRLIVTEASYRPGRRHVACSLPSINECITTARTNALLLGELEKGPNKEQSGVPAKTELPI